MEALILSFINDLRKTFRWAVFSRAVVLCVLAPTLLATDLDSGWQLGPFVRPPDATPIIAPLKDVLFQGALPSAPVRWESLHTFNPGAVVRDGKIYVLYRAEDDTGKMRIGGH